MAGSRLDIEHLKQMGVYKKAPTSAARRNGSNVLGVRWVDVKNAGGAHRSRLVGRRSRRTTPLSCSPLHHPSSRYLVRRAARNTNMSNLHVDVARAYLNADAAHDINAKLPAGDLGEHKYGMCG